MTKHETKTAFYNSFEHLVKQAAVQTGDTSEMLNELKAFFNIDTADIAENNRRLQLKELETEKEQAIKNIAKLSAEYEATETEGKKQEIKDALNKEYETLNKTIAAKPYNRFSTWDDYFNKCFNYDPSKDFTPSMLAGLRFPNGTISYIGARPGGGKSTLLVNLAREALAAGHKAFLVNLEMLNNTIITNYALSFMYATATDAERRELEAAQSPQKEYYSLFKRETDTRNTFDKLRERATSEIKQILETNLFIYDGTGGRLETIIKDIESKVNAGDVVLIDYIQRMPPPGDSRDQRYIQIKQTSNTLLSLALKKDVVIISGAQFGRQTKDNKGKEATMDDFREGGDIEQDGHNALAIETVTDKDGNETGRYIKVLKMREGGNKYTRQSLRCHFKYLHIAGLNQEYKLNEKPGGENPGQKEKKVWTPGGKK